MISTRLSPSLFEERKYEVIILDVNSLFLFSNNPPVKLYEFINTVKDIQQNKNILFINVIDNGLNRRMVRRCPDYKGNRVVSKESSRLGGFGSQNRDNKHKQYIDRIHKLDKQFKNHLTCFNQGESDFKIGFIHKQISQFTNIKKKNILTVANDKDMILTSIMGDVLLKRVKNRSAFQFLFSDGVKDLRTFKDVFSLNNLAMNSVSDYYYYLLLNGDKIDNIKPILTEAKTIECLNYIYDIEKKYNLDLICKYIGKFKPDGNTNDISKNAYLIDIFNENTFTGAQRSTMDYTLTEFFRRNGIKINR